MSSFISSCQNKSDSSDMETCVGLNGDIYMNQSGNFLDTHIEFIICTSEDFRLCFGSNLMKSMSGSLFSPEIKSVSTAANIFGVSKDDSSLKCSSKFLDTVSQAGKEDFPLLIFSLFLNTIEGSLS